jgi:hypothetical protein
MRDLRRRSELKKRWVMLTFSMLLLVGLAGTFGGANIAEAASGVWNSCPRGRVNCAYPGQCSLYIDTNSDSICDRSQSNPQTSSTTATTRSSNTAVPTITTTKVATGSTITPAVTTTGTAITTSTSPETASSSTATTNGNTAISNSCAYYFIPIFLTVIALYGMTWILSARKILGTALHRKIWNTVLLIAALISFVLGMFLTLNLDLGTHIRLPFDILFWHVEAGIALGIVGIFHILWHWRYFIRIMGTKSLSKDLKTAQHKTGESVKAGVEN